MKKLVLAAAAAGVLTLGVVGLASASHTITADSHSTIVNGWDPKNKPTCPAQTLAPQGVGSIANGFYGPIEIYGFNGESFNWRIRPAYLSVYDMAVVLVKGGPSDLEQYNYDYAGGGLDDYDEGLTGPPNTANNKGFFGASNALFCFDPKGGGYN